MSPAAGAAATLIFPTYTSRGLGRIRIATDGDITPWSAQRGSYPSITSSSWPRRGDRYVIEEDQALREES